MILELPKILVSLSFAILLIALLLTLIRLIIGPSTNDRIASMDLIASIVSSFILVYSVVINNTLYIDIVIIISLISFIGTVAVSTYLKQKNTKE
jgi:multicomponent Na+:H+ antiporter subunit F